jgi:tetratricopeptide (TPR) repeat protein
MTVPPSVLFERAVSLHRAGDFAQAEPLYRQVLTTDPSHGDAHRLLGALLLQRQEPALALPVLERALMLGQRDPGTLNNIGLACNELERFDEALKHLDAALALKPDYAAAYNNRGVALQGLKKPHEAMASFEAALRHQPAFPDALVNLGKSYIGLQRLEDAVALYSKLATLPSHADIARFNRAKARAALGQYQDALADYDAVRVGRSLHAPAATMGAATVKLLLGEYDEGWRLYESRWQADPKLKPRAFPQTPWRGEPLAGKTILLHAEQGFGDTLQFIRYVPLVKERAATVILIIQPQLIALLQPQWPDVQMLADAKSLPAFDVHCPLMSLPLVFNTTLETIPAAVPYIFADADKRRQWRSRLERPISTGPGLSQRKIGVVWSGRPTHVNDANRSVDLALLAPLFQLPYQFHAVQKDITVHDQYLLDSAGVKIHAQHLVDFADTAALLAELDLIITVDTSVAHLAGALGKPVWILLPFDPDFRWLLGRSDSPWYPTATLYRQPAPGNWTNAVQRIIAALKA